MVLTKRTTWRGRSCAAFGAKRKVKQVRSSLTQLPRGKGESGSSGENSWHNAWRACSSSELFLSAKILSLDHSRPHRLADGPNFNHWRLRQVEKIFSPLQIVSIRFKIRENFFSTPNHRPGSFPGTWNFCPKFPQSIPGNPATTLMSSFGKRIPSFCPLQQNENVKIIDSSYTVPTPWHFLLQQIHRFNISIQGPFLPWISFQILVLQTPPRFINVMAPNVGVWGVWKHWIFECSSTSLFSCISCQIHHTNWPELATPPPPPFDKSFLFRRRWTFDLVP